MPASKKPKFIKNCAFCNKEFLTNNVRRIYCSASCNTFMQRSKDPDKHRAYAAAIMRKRPPEKKAKDAIRKKDLRLQREYGIDSDDYSQMIEDQNGKCFICKSLTKLVIDHNHATGKVRKLLCHACNRGLGFFSDNPTLLLLASNYVKEWGV